MNTAELKLELFRRIDKLEAAALEAFYHKVLALLQEEGVYELSVSERRAIDAALEASEREEGYSSQDVKEEAQKRFPKLRFK